MLFYLLFNKIHPVQADARRANSLLTVLDVEYFELFDRLGVGVGMRVVVEGVDLKWDQDVIPQEGHGYKKQRKRKENLIAKSKSSLRHY